MWNICLPLVTGLLERKSFMIYLGIYPPICFPRNCVVLLRRRWWGTVSKVFVKSMQLVSMGIPFVTASDHASKVEIDLSCIRQENLISRKLVHVKMCGESAQGLYGSSIIVVKSAHGIKDDVAGDRYFHKVHVMVWAEATSSALDLSMQ